MPGEIIVGAFAQGLKFPSGRPVTVQQLRVLRHLVCGAPEKDIARALGVSPSTVKHHTEKMLREIRDYVPWANRISLALWATKRGVRYDG